MNIDVVRRNIDVVRRNIDVGRMNIDVVRRNIDVGRMNIDVVVGRNIDVVWTTKPLDLRKIDKKLTLIKNVVTVTDSK